MARKSRKNVDKQEPVRIAPAKSQSGIYARLSVEDNNCSTGDSIQNQVAFLKEFVEGREEDFQLIDIYVDNGTTGTNFDREGWQRLLTDIKAGKIDCIIVKDFSRMGRNYIEVGNYMEKIFPFLGVRVVAVNDNFDSIKKTFKNDMLMNSLTNIVNEYYARDISRKVMQARKAMQDNGEYTSGKFPYGYKRSEENKRKMAVDLEAADVVRKIFEWRISGKSCTWIANSLNELVIPSPGLYRFMNGEKSYSKSRNARWKSENISDIVTNPVYLGHTVQGKSQSSHFRDNGKAKRLPREEWKIAENTHEPLVTEEQFAITMEMAEKSRKKYEERIEAHADIPKMENPLRGKIYCAGCGRKMFRRSRVTKGVRNYHFYCDSRRRKLDGSCKQSYISEASLMEAIREAAEKQIQLLGTLKGQWMRPVSTAGNSGEVQGMAGKKEMEEEIRLIKKQKRGLYEDLREGMLEQEDFEGEWGRLAERQLWCEKKIKDMGYIDTAEKEAMEAMQKYPDKFFELKSGDIPPELLASLIEKITVVSQEQIEITYAYSDIIEKWCEEAQLLDKKGAGENERWICGNVS